MGTGAKKVLLEVHVLAEDILPNDASFVPIERAFKRCGWTVNVYSTYAYLIGADGRELGDSDPDELQFGLPESAVQFMDDMVLRKARPFTMRFEAELK